MIAHLPVDTNGDAGLFESFSGGTLADTARLTGAQIRGTGRVGGLACGTLSGYGERYRLPRLIWTRRATV
ncbi:MAG: hypothetical protein ACLUEU_10820 [Oscillospiraceae bacterium]